MKKKETDYCVELEVKSVFGYKVKAKCEKEAKEKARAMMDWETNREDFEWWHDYNAAKASVIDEKDFMGMEADDFEEYHSVKLIKTDDKWTVEDAD